MTSVLDPPVIASFDPGAIQRAAPVPAPPPRVSVLARLSRVPRPPLAALVALWLVAVLGGVALVVYGFGPSFQDRAQRSRLKHLRTDMDRAANEASGLGGVTVAKKPPDIGASVAILEIGAMHLQQAVLEGTGASQTRVGPGHVPGTAGLGQPGNSVVVGRHKAFGGPFADIAALKHGTKILVTTTQGQSVYQVDSVRHATVGGSSWIDKVYGPSADDRLTLVSSASWVPWNSSEVTVVVAKMEGTAFAPTPQGGRHDSQIGSRGDPGVLASVTLAVLLYGLVMAGGVILYRRLRPSTAYLLTIAPVVAFTVVFGETLSRLLPAWT